MTWSAAQSFTHPSRYIRTLLLLLALLVGTTTPALAQGTINGRVTSATTSLGLPNTAIWFFDLFGEGSDLVAFATTDALGA